MAGMVAFIKTLVDEVGTGDITKPELGISDYRTSKFEKILISPGQVLSSKSGDSISLEYLSKNFVGE